MCALVLPFLEVSEREEKDDIPGVVVVLLSVSVLTAWWGSRR